MTRAQWLSRLAAISRTTPFVRVMVEAGRRRVEIVVLKRGRPKVVLPDTSSWDAAAYLDMAMATRRAVGRFRRRSRRRYAAEAHADIIGLCRTRKKNPARARILG